MIRLDDTTLPNVAEVGGKGLNLIKLTQAGLDVPPGFIVKTKYFARSVDGILGFDHKIALVDLKNVEMISGEIVQKVMAVEFDKDFKQALESAFEILGCQHVAVRSSAVCEDGQNASWAGQLATELNVQMQDLEKSIKKCWASAYSPRALTYAAQNKVKLSEISVAVVVQKMVDSHVSGVAFSVNPVTKNSDEIVIEAVYGLGEALVSGVITPDEYIVKKSDCTDIKATVATQNKQLKLNNMVTDWVEVPKGSAEIGKLDLDMLRQLIEAIKSIENYMQCPVDIEWAIENNKLYFTQTRPITTIGMTVIKE
jgi:phosphoenolpyruvate synthase/pyruvate phosphate dikinase